MNINGNIEDLTSVIDYTLLSAVTTPREIKILCSDATKFGYASVCVAPGYVPLAAKELFSQQVKTCCVIGFPFGGSSPVIKADEAKLAIRQGADEIDLMINLGYLKEKDYAYVKQDIRGVVDAAKSAIVKVIIETCYLDSDEMVKACELAVSAGAQFVSTSTGFGTGGATVEDILLIRDIVGDSCSIKASGGINTFTDAVAFLEAGADRIEQCAGVDILKEPAESY
jgi:deoxyribose-phosphate aldolase